MATHKRAKTRFTGVFSRTTLDPKRKHNGRPDRVFDICWRDAEGKQCWEVVGWLSDGMSEQAASYLRAEQLMAAKIKSLPSSVHSQIPPDDESQKPEVGTILFSSIAESYLLWLEGESKYADRERFRYDTHIKASLGDKPVESITITEANTFKHELLPKMAIGSVKKCLNLCRAIYFHASISGVYNGLNPFSRASGFKVPQGATECERYLTPDEARTLLDELAKRSPQLRDMCYLSLHTGARATEIFSIRGGDLVPQAGFFWVDGKGGKRDKIAASKEIFDMLASYKRKPHEYVFQTKDGAKIKQTSDTLRRTVEDLGLSPRTVIKAGRKEIRVKLTPEKKQEHQRKKIWFHTFRHTFASWLAQSGTVSLLELRDLLRHESTQMTERYAHMIPDKLVEQSSKINRILCAS